MSRDVCPVCQSPDACDCADKNDLFEGKVLCERCSKETLCCEKSWELCEGCDGDGEVLEYGEDGDDDHVRECAWCMGAGGWWRCDCDENGLHGVPR